MSRTFPVANTLGFTDGSVLGMSEGGVDGISVGGFVADIDGLTLPLKA